ncbi:MAG: hypothetical protein QOI59_5597 [Gammaproteobacteria bacterium]|jgi:hypothetical protein|nr:hypothetical protein [Gammaproteobacteria bacterium]
MHDALSEEYEALPELVDLPFTIRTGDESVLFENLWVGPPVAANVRSTRFKRQEWRGG